MTTRQETADIVERLRAQANDWQGQGDDFYGPLFGEAADEIERLRDRTTCLSGDIYRLRKALELVMGGGNHLANVLITKIGPAFADHWPPGTPHKQARAGICTLESGTLQDLDLNLYDVWCCWNAIMQARKALARKP